MTTHKIDPALVREVLDLDAVYDVREYHRTFNFLGKSTKGIRGQLQELTKQEVNLHEFKDMAIEWMAKRNYIIERVAGCVVAKRNWEILEEFIYGGSKPDYLNMLSAELAAISFVWEQIREEKNTLIALNPRVAIGLRQQGKLDVVETMLKDGKSWDEIGKEIGWCPITAEKWYNMEKEKKDE